MTKTISLADDAYDALAAVKRPGESFSDVARRLARTEAKRVLFDSNIRVEMSDAEAKRRIEFIYRERDATRTPRVDSQ